MSKKIKREYTDDELIRRVTDIEEIKKVANKRVYYMINEWREQELQDLWVTDPSYQATASFGKNTGYYVGMDNIRSYYVTKHAADLGDGVGTMNAHPISTGLVELAGDGQTAKGLWYCIGQETVPGKAMWVTGKVAMDFVKEGDSWKIWHVVEANDLSGEAGARYSDGTPYWEPEHDPIVKAFGTPDVAELTHDPNFNWWDNYPAMPEPYDTWSDGISYGPEGFKPAHNKGLGAKEGRNYK